MEDAYFGVHRNPLKNLASEERKQAIGNLDSLVSGLEFLVPGFDFLAGGFDFLAAGLDSLGRRAETASLRGQFRDRRLEQAFEGLPLLGKASADP